MNPNRADLARRLKEVAEEIFLKASRLEEALTASTMSAEAESFWFGRSRREQITHLRRTGRQILRRLHEQQ